MGRLIGALDASLNHASASQCQRGMWRGPLAVLILVGVAADDRVCGSSAACSCCRSGIVCGGARRQHADRAAQPAPARRARSRRRSSATASPPAARRWRRSSAAIPTALDEAGVARAAIESLAENFSDGVVAPVFWMALGGPARRRRLQGDQHRRQHDRPSHAAPRSLRLGGGAARRSRQPAGVAARRRCWSSRAAALVPGALRRRDAWRAVVGATPGVIARPMPAGPRRRWPARSASRSPGRGVYGGVAVDDAVMGDGRREATAADIRARARALPARRRAADRAGRRRSRCSSRRG